MTLETVVAGSVREGRWAVDGWHISVSMHAVYGRNQRLPCSVKVMALVIFYVTQM